MAGVDWLRALLRHSQDGVIRRRAAALRSGSLADRALAYLDHPAGAVTTGAVHVRGWIACASPETAAVSINGRRADVHYYARPDVERTLPGRAARGFSTFVRVADLGEASHLDIRVEVDERVVLECRHPILHEAREASAHQAAITTLHRQWLIGRLNCVRCGDRLDDGYRCPACGFDCSGPDVLNCVPPEFASRDEIEFAGAVCSHGYDADVEAVLQRVERAGGMALDCGAGWRSVTRERVITTEIHPYPGTDVLAVGQRLPFADGIFDAVLSLHVLEHVSNPFVCANELMRVLKPGGTLLAITPMIVPEHGFPHHYFNPTREGLLALFATGTATSRVFVPHVGHAINGLHTVLRLYADSLPPSSHARARFLELSVAEILATPIEGWLDQDVAQELSDEGRMRLAANFGVEIVKAE